MDRSLIRKQDAITLRMLRWAKRNDPTPEGRAQAILVIKMIQDSARFRAERIIKSK